MILNGWEWGCFLLFSSSELVDAKICLDGT